MDPKMIWQSKDGNIRIIESFIEDDDGDYTRLFVEQMQGRAMLGEPIWVRLDHGALKEPVLPESALRELLVQFGLRTAEMD